MGRARQVHRCRGQLVLAFRQWQLRDLCARLTAVTMFEISLSGKICFRSHVRYTQRIRESNSTLCASRPCVDDQSSWLRLGNVAFVICRTMVSTAKVAEFLCRRCRRTSVIPFLEGPTLRLSYLRFSSPHVEIWPCLRIRYARVRHFSISAGFGWCLQQLEVLLPLR